MTISLISKSYGTSYANLRGVLRDSGGSPAQIYGSPTSGVVNTSGSITLSSTGVLSAYVDDTKTFTLQLFQHGSSQVVLTDNGIEAGGSSSVNSAISQAEADVRYLSVEQLPLLNTSVGPYATLSALQTAYPASTSAGKTGLVGTSAPYVTYLSDGTSWLERYVPSQSLTSGAIFTPSTLFRIVLTAQANGAAYLYGYDSNGNETLHKMSYIVAGDTETWVRDVGNDVTFRVVFNPLEISASLYR